MDDLFAILTQIPDLNKYSTAGMLIFARLSGFIFTAPVLSRKDIPSMVKISFALLLTISFIGMTDDFNAPAGTSYCLCLFLNIMFGALIGFVATVIYKTVEAGGEMMNMQMGLQTSVMFDSGSKSQVSLMGKFFAFLSVVIYIEIGGLYWLFVAFERGFEVFPLYGTFIAVEEIVSINKIITLTGNVLFLGLQLASPILLTTLCQDIILGIISKTAPQINVFQLSFVFKPVVGATILFLIFPLLTNTIIDYFVYYSTFW